MKKLWKKLVQGLAVCAAGLLTMLLVQKRKEKYERKALTDVYNKRAKEKRPDESVAIDAKHDAEVKQVKKQIEEADKAKLKREFDYLTKE
jgi:cellobiose-specific phosphotransferase system component IIB